jgi:hypothetical protein
MNQGEGLQVAAVGRRLYDLAIEHGLGVNAPFDWFHQAKRYRPGGDVIARAPLPGAT